MVGPVPGIKQNLVCTSFRSGAGLSIQTMTTIRWSLDRLYDMTGVEAANPDLDLGFKAHKSFMKKTFHFAVSKQDDPSRYHSIPHKSLPLS